MDERFTVSKTETELQVVDSYGKQVDYGQRALGEFPARVGGEIRANSAYKKIIMKIAKVSSLD